MYNEDDWWFGLVRLTATQPHQHVALDHLKGTQSRQHALGEHRGQLSWIRAKTTLKEYERKGI